MSFPAGSVTVVLHQTRSPVNVGSAARACANFGLTRILLADPSGFDLAHARRVAAGAAEVLEQAMVSPALEEAWGNFSRVVATTARVRHGDRSVGPTEAARYILEQQAAGERVALLFGNESSGLPGWAIRKAHLVSRIETHEAAPALNLAQAVLLHGWELARLRAEAEAPAPPPEASEAGTEPLDPRVLERIRTEARALLLEVDFLDPQSPDRILNELERVLLHGHPNQREGGMIVSLLRRLQYRIGAG
ncbi:MAG: RNA methyltransferase [Deltaproteobacteria bacterium]|nr:RNA methyltransferase [Deltaproteobacteria bacterium]